MKLTRTLRIVIATVVVLGSLGGGAYVLASAGDTPPKAPGTSDPNALPAGWKECADATAGYRIGYPAGWHTAGLGAGKVCMLFDPKPIVITPGSEYPLVRLEVVATGADYAEIVAARVHKDYFAVTTRKDVTVAGRKALLIETVANGEDGLFGKGTIVYGYVVDVDGKAFIIQTAMKSDADAAAARRTIDTAASTLRFAK